MFMRTITNSDNKKNGNLFVFFLGHACTPYKKMCEVVQFKSQNRWKIREMDGDLNQSRKGETRPRG